MQVTQGSFIGRMTGPQLNPPTRCGARVTTGILIGQGAAYAAPEEARHRATAPTTIASLRAWP